VQLLSKDIPFSSHQLDLKHIIFEEDMDSVIGYHNLTRGVLVLFFSHRYNKQLAVIVNGTHDIVKIQKSVDELLRGL
jgi:hypothetical protein